VPERRSPRVEWVAALFLASGAALVVYIVSGISLRWTFIGLGLGAAAVVVLALRRMPPRRRAFVRRRIAVGAVAGLAATLAYDAVRYGLVEFAGLQIRPFEAWRLFGLALTDTDLPPAAVFAAGTAFHLCNGVAFGIAYTLAFGQRGPIAGIIWALVLETFMVSLYPGWLGLKALDEFISVSVAGHLAYGGVLGYLARSLLRTSRWGDHDRDALVDAPAGTPSPGPAG
jgi:hypothetical protein